MTKEELQRKEEEVLKAQIATDRGSSGRKLKAKAKQLDTSSSTGPNPAVFWIAILIACIIIAILVAKIIGMIVDSSSSSAKQQPELNGFEALKQDQVHQVSANEVSQNVVISNDGTLNPYYLSASLASARPDDTLFQIGDVVYDLPVKLQELENNGITLITLGNQPPAEDVYLEPQLRNGFIQFKNDRYEVTLKNGTTCNYHDLIVVGIRVNGEPGCNFYGFGGLTIGSEEADIPQQTVAALSTDAPFEVHTYYQWGNVENYNNTKTGRYTCITSDNTYGKVTEIFIFDDATITGN